LKKTVATCFQIQYRDSSIETEQNHNQDNRQSGQDSSRDPPKYESKALPLTIFLYDRQRGHAVTLLVEALCYKPEGRGFIPYEVTGFFNRPNPSSHIMVLGSAQPLTETSTRNLPGG
jgi:hypothetical protein